MVVSPRRRRVLLPLLSLLAATSAVAARPGAVTVALVNGGLSPEKNYESHLVHLEVVRAALLARGLDDAQLTPFISDGGLDRPDMARQDAVEPAWQWLLAGTREARLLPDIEVVSTDWVGGAHRPATASALYGWLAVTAAQQARGDTLLLYFTDHGYRDRETHDAGLWLWEEDKVPPAEVGGWLAEQPPGARTVLVMSQCYSGAFAELAWAEGPPDGDLCGFFSVPATRPAYGCYPDGRSRAVGHGYRFADALAGAQTLDEAHRWIVLADQSPDVPLTTSELYLQHLLEAAAERRGVSVAALAGELLAAHAETLDWSAADTVAAAFGLPPVRRLEDLDPLKAELAELEEAVEDLERRWRKLRERAAADRLEDVLATRPRLDRLAGRERAQALVEAAQAAPDWDDLARLAAQEQAAEATAWGLKSQEGGLERVRAALLTLAGEQLLLEGRRVLRLEARGLARLRACEATAVGTAPQAELPPLPPPYPGLAELRQQIAALEPSFLGVKFSPLDADEAARAGGLAGGAVRVEDVVRDSPAARAGIEAGDILVGPPGVPLRLPHQLGTWVALADRSAPVALEVRRGRQTLTVQIQLVPSSAR